MRNHELEHLWDTLEYLSSLSRNHTREETFYDKAKAGHDDYGIVHDPCVVHLKKYESVAMWLWQEGSDWQC